MNENLSLGRIAGIHVGLNWSLLVIGALIAWSLATGILPSAAPGQTSSAYWTAGVVSAFVYLASLLAHELAHSVVAMLVSKKRLDVDLRASGDWECHRAVRGRTCPDMRLTERCTWQKVSDRLSLRTTSP